MDAIGSDHLIRDEAALAAIYGESRPAAIAKEVDYIHPHYRAMIEASPFMVLATSGPEGLDASPAATRRASSMCWTTGPC